uniref:Nucleocapsid n=1 Tax=Ronne virus TaxID=2707257 RepID=A0A859D0V7_9VIRU|nr:nucleocapsid [Ronne virus]
MDTTPGPSSYTPTREDCLAKIKTLPLGGTRGALYTHLCTEKNWTFAGFKSFATEKGAVVSVVGNAVKLELAATRPDPSGFCTTDAVMEGLRQMFLDYNDPTGDLDEVCDSDALTLNYLTIHFGSLFLERKEFRDRYVPLIEYDGFDAKLISTKLCQAPTVTDSKLEDFSFLIMVAVSRGNNVDKISKTMTDEGARLLDKMVRNYGIVPKRGDKANREAITLSRIALCMPHLTCTYMMVAKNLPVSKETMDEMLPPNMKYPHQMMHSVFGSVVPKSLSEEVTKDLVDAHLLHQIHLGLCLNRKARLTHRSYFVSCENFAKSAKDTDFVKEKYRLGFLRKWGLILGEKGAETVPPNVKAAAVKYREMREKTQAREE